MAKKRPSHQHKKKKKAVHTKSTRPKQTKPPEPVKATGPETAADPETTRAPGSTGNFFKKNRYFILVIFLALIFRLAYFIEMKEDPEFLHANVDALYHDYWAWGMVSGQWEPPHNLENPGIPDHPYFRPPFYPYFLSVIYRIFGHHQLAPRVIQMLLGVLGCGILFLLTRKIFGDKIALAAGVLMAVYWAFVFYEKELREVALLVFFLPLLILWMIKLHEKPTISKFIFCGLLLGCIIITRPNFLLFIPFAVGWLIFYNKLKDKRKKYLYIGIFILCTILPVSGVTLRNITKGNDFVLISSNMGINLYVGNNPTATGNTIALPPEIPLFRNAFMYPTIVKYIESVEGRKLKHSEVSGYFVRKALEHMRNNPSHTAYLVFKKAVMFVGGIEIPSERDLVAGRKNSLVLKIIPLNFALVVSLGLVGMIVYFSTVVNMKRKKQEDIPPESHVSRFPYVILILFLAGIYYVSYLPFFITSRFRMCIIPFILIFSGYIIYQIYNRIMQKRISKGIIIIAAVILVYIFASINYFHFQRDMAKAEYDRALAFTRSQNFEEAIKGYRKAIAHRQNYPDAYNNLGNMLRKVEKTREAIENYKKALEYEPRHYFANLNLAQIYYSLNQLDEAVDYYSKALEINPSEYIYNVLSNTLFKSGKVKEAIDVLSDAVKIYGRKTNFLNNLGILYAFRKEPEKAKQLFLEVIEKNPDDVQALLNLGRLYSGQDHPDEARKYFQRVLELDPQNKAAREGLRDM
ncbi:MAG: tetratricopeptide repeat protein [Candidatus Aminicenantes bacterium]|nr:MAG: tetratricopeptide repeat protein [Candidatus Aminicenantes bacterium]